MTENTAANRVIYMLQTGGYELVKALQKIASDDCDNRQEIAKKALARKIPAPTAEQLQQAGYLND